MSQQVLQNNVLNGVQRGAINANFTELYAAIAAMVTTTVSNDPVWSAAGDLVVGVGSHSASVLSMGNALQVLRVNSGRTGLEYATISAGGGDALTSGTLAQFAATTSLQLKTLISDETGSGALVFANACVLVGPALGTPVSGTLTSCTGLPVSTGLSGMATGVATFLTTPSSANLLAALTDKTGTGLNVFGTAPTISGATLTGITTTDGANITTANAMGALAIDVTKGLNTKSIAADSTFTFSATPTTANTWFSVHITNTDTNPHAITFPSAFSIGTQSARTTCPIPASGQLWMMFRYDGTNYHVFGEGQYLNNFTATANPAVTDDVAKGYGPGSIWGNTTANTLYWCESNASGAAVWNAVAGTGSGDMLLGSAQTITGAKTFNDGTLVLAGSTSGTATIHAAAVAGTGVLTLPAGTDTLVGKATTDTLTNKTLTSPVITGGTVDTFGFGYDVSPINSQSANYTTVLTDKQKTIFHPAADTTARTFTIAANSSVAYPLGTMICFDNDVGAGSLTIAINTDTLVLVGAAGTTGSRTLAAGGRAVAIKVTATRWRISGSAELS